MDNAKIRPTVLLKIKETIDGTSFFLFHEFQITNPSNYASKIKIQYLHRDAWLESSIPSEKTKMATSSQYEYLDYKFSGEHSPGEVNVTETFVVGDLGGFLKVITRWLNLLKEDLINEPTRRALESQQAQINNLVESVGDIEDIYFTNQEAEALRQRLDALEKRFEEQLRNDKTMKKADLDERLEKMTKQIEALKQQVGVLSKKSWLKTFVGRFVTWSADPHNQKLLESGVKTVKQIVLGNTSESGPQ